MVAAEVEAAVAGDFEEWDSLSEESSFYGDEKTKSKWEQCVPVFDEQEYWEEVHDKLVSVMAYKARPTTAVHLQDDSGQLLQTLNVTNGVKAVQVSSSEAKGVSSFGLRNPLEGLKNAKQLNESVADFLRRAPPLDSLWSSDGWLWVANPYATGREFEAEIEVFTTIGRQYLDDFTEQRRQLEAKHPDKVAGTITRMLKPERDKLKADIEQLAATHDVVHGKWMLFPHVDKVPQTWRTVVEGVANNQLGDMAKIATGSDKDPDDGLRVICIYTKDFTDTDDVKRVCRALDDLGLIPAERGIFYKADAYTYLNITSNNPYSIAASLYASRDVLKSGNAVQGTKRAAPPPSSKSTKGKEPVRKKQATLDWSF